MSLAYLTFRGELFLYITIRDKHYFYITFGSVLKCNKILKFRNAYEKIFYNRSTNSTAFCALW